LFISSASSSIVVYVVKQSLQTTMAEFNRGSFHTTCTHNITSASAFILYRLITQSQIHNTCSMENSILLNIWTAQAKLNTANISTVATLII